MDKGGRTESWLKFPSFKKKKKKKKGRVKVQRENGAEGGGRVDFDLSRQ